MAPRCDRVAGRRGPQPDLVLTPDHLRSVTAHLARRHTPRIPEPPNPGNHRAYPDPIPRRRLVAGHSFIHDSPDHPLTQIHRERFRHPCWPPYRSQHLESEMTPSRESLFDSEPTNPALAPFYSSTGRPSI